MRSIDQATTERTSPTSKRPRREEGKVQPFILVLVLLIMGMVIGGSWYMLWGRNGNPASGATGEDIQLSDSTRAALRRLRSPVDIRFYTILGNSGSRDSLRAFSGRVDHLLSAYAKEFPDKINVTRYNAGSEADLEAASSDGLKVFNLDKGEPCYLGLCVEQKDRKESLPRIAPEWEQALEADLTRVILRVSRAQAPGAPSETATQAGSTAREEVKRAISDLDSVSVEKAREILRTRALEDIKTASAELQTRIQQAQERLRRAQDEGSETGQKEAMKEVQEAQAAQTAKLKEIAARLQSQITAMELLKGVPPTAP